MIIFRGRKGSSISPADGLHITFNDVVTGYTQTEASFGTTYSASQYTTPTKIYLASGLAYFQNVPTTGEMTISNVVNNYKVFNSIYYARVNSNPLEKTHSTGGYSNLSSLITKISLVAQTSTIGIGSRFIVLGMK
jgi:hypothetical protein